MKFKLWILLQQFQINFNDDGDNGDDDYDDYDDYDDDDDNLLW